MSATGDAVLLARVAVSLIVVVLLALLGARLARRTGLRGPGRGLRLLERLPLSREAFLAVVAVADRGLVLGVTAHGVQVVGELDTETVTRVYPAPEPGTGGSRQPRRWLPGTGRRAEDLTGNEPSNKAGNVAGSKTGNVAGVEVGPNGVKVTRLADGARTAPARSTGGVLDPRTWRQAVDALRDLTVRRG